MLKWVLQCHVYMVLTGTDKARFIITAKGMVTVRVVRDMNPDITALSETSHKIGT